MRLKNEELEAVARELRSRGIPYSVEDRSKHLVVNWRGPDGSPRQQWVASSGSDWRGPWNVRARVRKTLREDGVEELPVGRFRPTLERALKLPEPPELPLARLERLEADNGALLDLVCELQGLVEGLSRKLSGLKVVATLTFDSPVVESPAVTAASVVPALVTPEVEEGEAPAAVSPVATVPVTAPRLTQRQRILDALPESWMSKENLSVRSGVKYEHLARYLWGLKNEGLVENGMRGWWRRVRVSPVQGLLNGCARERERERCVS